MTMQRPGQCKRACLNGTAPIDKMLRVQQLRLWPSFTCWILESSCQHAGRFAHCEGQLQTPSLVRLTGSSQKGGKRSDGHCSHKVCFPYLHTARAAHPCPGSWSTRQPPHLLHPGPGRAIPSRCSRSCWPPRLAAAPPVMLWEFHGSSLQCELLCLCCKLAPRKCSRVRRPEALQYFATCGTAADEQCLDSTPSGEARQTDFSCCVE